MPHYPLFRLLSTSVRLIADLSISQNALLLSANQAYPNIWQRTIIMDYMPWATELQQKNHLRMQVVSLESGGDLLSRAVSSQVPSALKVLTSVFGMGTGGTPSPLPPETVSFLWGWGRWSSLIILAQGIVASSGSLPLPWDFRLCPSGCSPYRTASCDASSLMRATLSHSATRARCHTLTTAQSERHHLIKPFRLSLEIKPSTY